MSKKPAMHQLREAIKQQIELTKVAENTSALKLRPVLEKMNKANISALLAIHDALNEG